MKRAGVFLPMVLAAACDEESVQPPRGRSPGGPDDRVTCATGGAQSMEPVCTLEMQQGPDGTILIIRAPDGGFRRLLVTRDGRGVTTADGAEPAVVTPVDERSIQVSVDGDRYRLPATVAR